MLLTLLAECNIEIPNEFSEVPSLNVYAERTRYPGPWDEVTEEEYQRALALAEDTVGWAKRSIA